MIYVLYGQPGSGKTTLSNKLKEKIMYDPAGCDPEIIDGDEFRELFNQADYSKIGRENNIKAANIVATYISKTKKLHMEL